VGDHDAAFPSARMSRERLGVTYGIYGRAVDGQILHVLKLPALESRFALDDTARRSGTYGTYGRDRHGLSPHILWLSVFACEFALGETRRGRVTYVSPMCHLWHVWTEASQLTRDA
jgi:hypothetical protein